MASLSGCSTLQISPEQRESIRVAAAKVLPPGANVSVAARAQDVVIAAHLLEGHSAGETSPYVRGDYETHDKLTRMGGRYAELFELQAASYR